MTTTTTVETARVYVITRDITVPPFFGKETVSFSAGQEIPVSYHFVSGNARVTIGQGEWVDIPADAFTVMKKTTTTTVTTTFEPA